MKTYTKTQYTGNENGWGEPTKDLGAISMHEATASELNSHFRNTGIRYEEGGKHTDQATKDEADHGERNLVVKDDKLKVTKNKPADLQKEQGKDKSDKVVVEPEKDAKPSDTTFERSDMHVEDAIDKKAADKLDKPAGTAGNQ